jgi:D-threo-aldose 1-dehydrogenase
MRMISPYDGIMRAYEQCHMRLGLNRIDLLVIHDLDYWHFEKEPKVAAHLTQLVTSGWRALEQLRKAGIVRGIGAGINELGMMPRFLDALDLDFFLVALRYTLMEQDVLKEEFPYCERRNVGIIIGGVFSSGITATGAVPGAKYNYEDASPEIMERVRRMEAGVQVAWRAARRRGAAVPLRSPDRRLRHPRRDQAGAGASERGELFGQHSSRALVGPQG